MSVYTNSLKNVGVYPATLVATLADYPNVAPLTLPYLIKITHPCDTSVLMPEILEPMTFNIGFVQTMVQVFTQFKDSISERLKDIKFCGERIYRMKEDYNFLNLIVPNDHWSSLFLIEVFTINESSVGNYTATLEV
jgi:hypothetical protein